MKKLDNKGFVLAEAIIVAVFVLGMFTLLITNVLPSISKYKKTLMYDKPEYIYLVDTFIKTMKSVNSDSPEGYYTGDDELKKTSGEYLCATGSFCAESIKKDYLNIKEVLFVKGIQIGTTPNLSRGMKEYEEYFKKHNSMNGTDYAVLIKFGDNNYAGLLW